MQLLYLYVSMYITQGLILKRCFWRLVQVTYAWPCGLSTPSYTRNTEMAHCSNDRYESEAQLTFPDCCDTVRSAKADEAELLKNTAHFFCYLISHQAIIHRGKTRTHPTAIPPSQSIASEIKTRRLF